MKIILIFSWQFFILWLNWGQLNNSSIKTNDVEIKIVVHAKRVADAGKAMERRQLNGPRRVLLKEHLLEYGKRQAYVSCRGYVSISLRRG